MSLPDLPKSTPRWLIGLLCAVEVDMEQIVRDSAPMGSDIEEVDAWAASHRTEAHRRLRSVLYGPEDGK